MKRKLKSIGKKVRPLRDRVLVQRLEYTHPFLFVAGITLHRGIVVATGPGRRLRRKTKFENKMGSSTGALYFEDGEETGKVRPMRVKVGDIVEFSPRNQIEWEFEGEKLLWIMEQSILWKAKEHTHGDGIVGLTSAGYDRHGNWLPDSGHTEIHNYRTG